MLALYFLEAGMRSRKANPPMTRRIAEHWVSLLQASGQGFFLSIIQKGFLYYSLYFNFLMMEMELFESDSYQTIYFWNQ